MYDLIMFFSLCSILIVTGFLCFVLGFLLTERPLFNVKPFNCRPCLTFWLTLLFGNITAWGFLGFTEIPLSRFSVFLVWLIVLLAAILNFFIAKRNTIITK